MGVEPGQRSAPRRPAGPEQALAALVAVSRRLAEAPTLDDALAAVADAAASSADVVVVCLADPATGEAVARAVSAGSRALAAQLEGVKIPLSDLPESEDETDEHLPDALRRIARLAGFDGLLHVPALLGGRLVGSVALM